MIWLILIIKLSGHDSAWSGSIWTRDDTLLLLHKSVCNDKQERIELIKVAPNLLSD